MFGRLACIVVVVGMTAVASAVDVPPDPGSAPLLGSPDLVVQPIPAENARQAGDSKSAKTQDPPSAPLPAAVWPGLFLLAALGVARATMSGRRRAARR
jgi:hypothetical protein